MPTAGAVGDLDVLENVHRLIAAPTGAGKSYFLGWLVEKLYAQRKPFVLLDTKTRNHFGLVALKEVKLLRVKGGARYNWERLLEYPYVLCIPTLKTKTSDLIEQYTELVDAIYTAGNERVIILEEAHLYNKNAYAPSPILELVAREGRGRRISLWLVTQRIQDFPKLLWSQCYYTYLLKFLIPQDIRYAEALIPNFGEINREMDRFDVLEYNHRSGEYRIIPGSNVNRATKHYG